jgi:hypothetical protein
MYVQTVKSQVAQSAEELGRAGAHASTHVYVYIYIYIYIYIHTYEEKRSRLHFSKDQALTAEAC